MGDDNCTADGLQNYLFPTEAEIQWPVGLQITCHLIFLLWLFIGVGLASDTFMNSIEEITSTKKTITLKDGSTKEVDVWNPTVANLSLMALGSSAPEILLSCVELFTSSPCADAYAPGPPDGTRVPASPKAQGSSPRWGHLCAYTARVANSGAPCMPAYPGAQ